MNRLQLIAPTQVRILGNVTHADVQYKKGDVIHVEQADADRLVEKKAVELVKASEKLESVNIWEEASEAVKARAQKQQERAEAEVPAGAAKVIDHSGTGESKTSNTSTTKS